MADASSSPPTISSAMSRFSVAAADGMWRAIEKALDNGYGVVFVTNGGGRFLGQATLADLRAGLRVGRHLDEPSASDFVKPWADSPDAVVAPVIDADGRLIDVSVRPERATIPVAEPNLTHRELRMLLDAFLSTWISSAGEHLGAFETRFAARCGAAYGVATSNGTVSLQLAMAALGIGPGDEVIVPDLTFPACANTVIHCGATPVLVDIDPQTWCLSVEGFERAITPRTRAVMPVHTFGRPAPMREIMDIARRHDLYVIEDCAEAPGAFYDGRPIGSFGDVASFSFFANKIITTGEGGICLTSDPALAERMRMLRSHGMRPDRRYWHDEPGFNFRLTNLQAAIGLAQLDRMDEFLADRRALEGLYRAALSDVPGVVFPPPARAPFEPVIWFVTVSVPPEKRAAIIAAAAAQKIDLRPMVNSMSIMPAYRRYARPCPNSRALSESSLHLPSSFGVGAETVARIADVFRSVLG